MTAPNAIAHADSARRFPRLRDPRPYQIGVQALLLCVGLGWLGLGLDGAVCAAMVGSALAAQLALTRLHRVAGGFDPRSALISALSLCLLLRTDSLGIAAAAGAGAIASKFWLRYRGAHLFNPSCIAIVAALALTDSAWISPGQWGHAAWLALSLGCLGLVVLTRAHRLDVSLAFLGAWAALMFGRAAWLGDPFAIPLHQMQNAALLIFAFYMLSDPKTTPCTRAGRITFALAVALAGYIAVFHMYEPAGLIYALAACAPLRFAIDRLLPGRVRVAHACAQPCAQRPFNVHLTRSQP